MPSLVAAAGVFLLAAFAPFEATRPILRLPMQAVTNLEAALLLALAAWGGALLMARRWPRMSRLAWASVAFVAAMSVAAAAAPSYRTNAWHMTGRFAGASAVLLLTIHGITSRARLKAAMLVVVIAGVVVACAAILEYLQVPVVLRALEAFRPSIAVIGTQLRAGGTLQYPTIASMYLEIVFAFGIGLMLNASDVRHTARGVVLLIVLLVVGEAIVLTFTRAGLITAASSLALAAWFRFDRHGIDGGFVLVLTLAIGVVGLLALSRSAQALWLRLSSEGQAAWYQAAVAAPPTLSMATDRTQWVTVAVTNAGRAIWDPDGDPPTVLSYHWLQADGDQVVAYEGERTAFDSPVAPGQTAVLQALVRAPRRPGEYRLEWDLVQEGRLWFSTEPDAPEPDVSCVTVTGAATGGPLQTTERPRRAVRPGRLVLWGAAARMIAAHPLLGVGPDNFRLLYGRFAGLAHADERTHTNSMYLEVLVGGGALAAAAFAWLLRESWRTFAAAARASDPLQTAIAAAGIAIVVHGTVDSFLSFAPTYILFALTIGFAAAAASGLETQADAHRV